MNRRRAIDGLLPIAFVLAFASAVHAGAWTQPEGALIVDPDGPQRCRLAYQLPDAPDAYGLSWAQATCQPFAASPELAGAGSSIH